MRKLRAQDLRTVPHADIEAALVVVYRALSQFCLYWPNFQGTFGVCDRGTILIPSHLDTNIVFRMTRERIPLVTGRRNPQEPLARIITGLHLMQADMLCTLFMHVNFH